MQPRFNTLSPLPRLTFTGSENTRNPLFSFQLPSPSPLFSHQLGIRKGDSPMKWYFSLTRYEGITERASCPERKSGYPPSSFQVKLLLNWPILNSEWPITCSQKSARHYRGVCLPHSWWDLRQCYIPTVIIATTQPPGPWHIAGLGRGKSRRLCRNLITYLWVRK